MNEHGLFMLLNVFMKRRVSFQEKLKGFITMPPSPSPLAVPTERIGQTHFIILQSQMRVKKIKS